MAVLFTLLTLLCSTGCGADNADPSSSPTTPAAPPPTTPPATPQPPAPPPIATRPTKAGAIAFARYYWAVVDFAQATGDTHLLRSIALRTCRACDGGADWIEKIAARGGRIHGGRHRIVQIWSAADRRLPADPYVGVIARLDVGAQTVSSAGSLDRHYMAGRDTVSMVFRFRRGAWQVTSWHIA
jgi:hypothetical protein